MICDEFFLLEIADEAGNRVSKWTAVQATCPRLKATVAFLVYLIWCVLHVVVNTQVTVKKVM